MEISGMGGAAEDTSGNEPDDTTDAHDTDPMEDIDVSVAEGEGVSVPNSSSPQEVDL